VIPNHDLLCDEKTRKPARSGHGIMRHFLLPALLLALACDTENRATAHRASPPKAENANQSMRFDSVWAAGPDGEERSAQFTYRGRSFVIVPADSTSDGVRGDGPARIRIDFPPEFFLEKVRVASIGNDILVLADISNYETPNGVLARFDSTLTSKWQHRIPAFNLADPVIRREDAYLSGIGYVEKLDLNTGASSWRHDNLYDRSSDAFNAFRPATFSGDTIIFQDAGTARTIRVLDASGAIVSR
jgi:hypothetical protein